MSRNAILGIVGVLVLVVIVLFASGFWSADVKPGAMPQVDVSAKGGEMPDVNLDSKQVVVGTKPTQVDVPKVTTEKEEVSVPVVGVTNN